MGSELVCWTQVKVGKDADRICFLYFLDFFYLLRHFIYERLGISSLVV